MILDGHNRYEICKKYKIHFETRQEKLKDVNEAKAWIIRNQLGRRNLTAYQRAKLALELESLISAKAKEKQREAGGAVRQKSDKAGVDTKKELAKIAGVSHDTIHKVKVIEREAPPEIKGAAQSGHISIDKAYKETKAPEGRGAVLHVKTTAKEISLDPVPVSDPIEYPFPISEDFKKAYEVFLNEFQKAWASKWTTTSKLAVVRCIKPLQQMLYAREP